MPDKDIDKIPITVEVPKADVWVRNDYRDIVQRLGEVHMIRACEHQFDDDWIPLYSIDVIAALQAEIERLRADAERYRWLRDDAMGTDTTVPIVCIVDRRGRPVTDDENYPHLLDGDELDAAIDAAMKEERK